jgi:hypothetical protein
MRARKETCRWARSPKPQVHPHRDDGEQCLIACVALWSRVRRFGAGSARRDSPRRKPAASSVACRKLRCLPRDSVAPFTGLARRSRLRPVVYGRYASPLRCFSPFQRAFLNIARQPFAKRPAFLSAMHPMAETLPPGKGHLVGRATLVAAASASEARPGVGPGQKQKK